MLAQVVLFDGFDPLDVIAPYEVLNGGALATGGRSRVELVSAEGARAVPSGLHEVTLHATAALDPEADLLVLPGALGGLPGDGRPEEDGIPAILGRALHTPLPGLLGQALAHPGTTVATVCGGSLLLAMAGLITGRRATGHRLSLELLAANGVEVVDVRVVDDGDLVTAASVTCGLDLALYLLERELGPQVAIGVEKLIAHERRGTVWRAATGSSATGGAA
ncbi:transcriptional regulator GlxA family with amidase domain [Crossiella equi]|uniref:Transcriptional regulator GlxA family with amidase domain n=1 Tax=Crossiella equi TaxID=130796 RepID=A0ABS5ALW2_9PSEU|nr:DJ-1/PfpI family protein [Crossiella equi]MBP2477548.1 transcriptional regulator GlxA family with amidase domain [Crossiella equi]